jgi:AcrR family transcriptional regulator
MARPASDARDRALGAALAIAARDSALSLTLDAVARESGLSKGGVMHHFPTKDALIIGMVEMLVTRFEAELDAAAQADPEPIGRQTRAFLSLVTSQELVAAGRALLAAVAVNPALLEPLHASYRRCHARIEADGIDAVNATLCVLAANSLWLNAVFGMPPPPRRGETIDYLDSLTRRRAKRASAARRR